MIAMKTLVFVAAMVVASAAAADDRCTPAPTDKTLEAGCLHIDLPTEAASQTTSTIKVDPKAVASMPSLPQVDTVVREVAVAE